jgi:hypothetical protein
MVCKILSPPIHRRRKCRQRETDRLGPLSEAPSHCSRQWRAQLGDHVGKGLRELCWLVSRAAAPRCFRAVRPLIGCALGAILACSIAAST